MAANNPAIPAKRPAKDRREDRAQQLALLQANTGSRGSLDDQAVAARRMLWRDHRPSHVRLRVGLVLHQPGGSPLRVLAASRGCAVQTLLVALFEAQCRTRRSASQPTKIPLRRSSTPGQTCWEELVTSPSVDRTITHGWARRPIDNRYEQVRRALERLEKAGRVRAARGKGRGRFEGFSLLHEATDNLGETETAYSYPGEAEECIAVPVEFFINGWVHVLTDNEIIAYLFVLGAAQNAGGTGGGVLLTSENWSLANGDGPGRRAGLVAQRELERFGLIDVTRPEARRADGTVETAALPKGTRLPVGPHYYLPSEQGLHFRALPRVLDALGESHQQDIDFATMVGRRPDGWTYARAVAELEQDALAAPAPLARAR